MNAADVERIVLFFYLAFLNEEKALSASSRVISFFKNKSRLESATREEIFEACSKSFYKIYDPNEKPYPTKDFPHLQLNGVDLGPWQSFSNLVSKEEILTLLYIHILKATEEQVAQIFQVSLGTVRHRLARALKSFPKEVRP